MNQEEIISTLEGYRADFQKYLSRYHHTDSGIHIDRDDDPIYRQQVREVIEFLLDCLGYNTYSQQISDHFDSGIRNFFGSPSYKSMQNIIGVIGAAITRIKRNPKIIKESVDIPSMRVTSQGVFFAGQYFDALRNFAEIISNAKNSIVLIDGYVNEDVLNLLTAKKPGAEVKILTKSVPPALKTSASAFNKQYGKLSIHTSDAFHDRFLIVDDCEFYHFGASIKDLGKRGFMFSRIEEPKIVDALRKEFAQVWANAVVKV